ncbi:MAG TPA: TIGR02281 family clan AA aspartic protease, partial [Aliiroseovarius sp.]|nr:TIGR02281 family clan AA aspartic protease [Aliiroseovarius sp.]
AVRTARTHIKDITLGGITDRNIPAVVNAGDMEGSLLGMTYLRRFSRIEIAGDQLILTR